MLISQQKPSFRYRDLILASGSKKDLDLLIPHKKEGRFTSSARAAIELALKSTSAKKVAIPAYTCTAVRAAVRAAEAKEIYYDCAMRTEEKDIEKIIKKVDLLILSYTFGYLPNIKNIQKLCKKHDVILLEDCAQALGAKHENKMVGSFGDIAVYSFGISKNIAAFGGYITSDIPLLKTKRPKFPLRTLTNNYAKLLLSPILLRPFLYPMIYKHFTNKVEEKAMPDYRLPRAVKRIIFNQAKRYKTIQKRRKKNFQLFKKALAEKSIKVEDSNSALYAVLLSKNQERTRKVFLKQGVDFGKMHSFKALTGSMRKAKATEAQVLTMNLNHKEKEMKKILRTIKKVNII